MAKRTISAQSPEPHAASASYDRKARTLDVRLTNGGSFAIPIILLAELRKLSDHDSQPWRSEQPESGYAGLALIST